MRRYLVDRDVPKQLLGASARPRLVVGAIDERRIGQLADRHIVAASGLAPAAPVTLEHWLCVVVAREECRLIVAAGTDAPGALG